MYVIQATTSWNVYNSWSQVGYLFKINFTLTIFFPTICLVAEVLYFRPNTSTLQTDCGASRLGQNICRAIAKPQTNIWCKYFVAGFDWGLMMLNQLISDQFVLVKTSYKKIISQLIAFAYAIGTRTTRMPAFCGYPPPPHGYQYYCPAHIRSPVKTRQSESYKFKEFAKTSNYWILKTLHTTHLKLLDKMCKYEMNPASIVEETERTRFCPQTQRRRDKVKPVYPLSTSLKQGV